MGGPGRPRICLALSPRLRAAVLLLSVLGAAAWMALRTPRYFFSHRLPVFPQHVAAATQRIDPNTASLASLRRLPGIGVLRGRDIIAYRQTHGPQAFRTAADLDAVYNIGPGTVRKIAPYLSLPADSEDR